MWLLGDPSTYLHPMIPEDVLLDRDGLEALMEQSTLTYTKPAGTPAKEKVPEFSESQPENTMAMTDVGTTMAVTDIGTDVSQFFCCVRGRVRMHANNFIIALGGSPPYGINGSARVSSQSDHCDHAINNNFAAITVLKLEKGDCVMLSCFIMPCQGLIQNYFFLGGKVTPMCVCVCVSPPLTVKSV